MVVGRVRLRALRVMPAVGCVLQKFYDGPFGHWKWLLALGGVSIVLFLLGYFLFDRLRDSFAEEV